MKEMMLIGTLLADILLGFYGMAGTRGSRDRNGTESGVVHSLDDTAPPPPSFP